MKAAVIVFPGSNCDRDLAVAFRNAGFEVDLVWHKDSDLPEGVDIVAIPGGFSFGDYLRCGAIAGRSPVMKGVAAHVQRGGYALGICNGFQVLCETGLLPGALMRNAGLKFICKPQTLRVETVASAFTGGYADGQEITVPLAHHDGNYIIEPAGLVALKDADRVAFRYVGNPNGSVYDIAGILSQNRRVLGMMPHPERAIDPAHGGADGWAMFTGLCDALVAA